MATIILLLGVAVLLGVIYLFYIGADIPPAIANVIKIAVILFLLLCILHQAGCEPPFLRPVPHEVVR